MLAPFLKQKIVQNLKYRLYQIQQYTRTKTFISLNLKYYFDTLLHQFIISYFCIEIFIKDSLHNFFEFLGFCLFSKTTKKNLIELAVISNFHQKTPMILVSTS